MHEVDHSMGRFDREMETKGEITRLKAGRLKEV
jgi:hypothetical protein